MEEIFENEEYAFPNEETSRHQYQRIALYAVYDVLTYIDMGEEVDAKGIVSSLCNMPYEEADFFVKGAVVYSYNHYQEAVTAFNSKMRKWTFARLNRVEQALLLLSYVHFYYIDPQVEKGIIIDVAVNLAKAYLDNDRVGKEDYKFVNAILDNVLVR